MKRILVFTTQMMKTGGIESHLREFCLQMACEVDIDLVVLNSSMLPENEAFFKKTCRRVYLGKNGRTFLRLFSIIRIGLLCRLSKYDAVYTNGQGNSIGFFVKLLGKQRKWVHHHHTSGDLEDQSTWTREYRTVLKTASNVIACSTRNAQDMEDVIARKIDSIPCFSRKIEFERIQRVSDGALRFGYYGRLIPEKGIDLMCQLSDDKDLQNVEFHIWGEGETYSKQYFERFGNLVYHGSFNGIDELSSVINSIDAFLLLSTHPEGLPICLLEAMSAGLPWMATDRGGITDIVCDYLSTRVISSVEDYVAVKAAVKLFAEDLLAGKVNRQLQVQQYEHKFSATALIKQWMETFLGPGNNYNLVK